MQPICTFFVQHVSMLTFANRQIRAEADRDVIYIFCTIGKINPFLTFCEFILFTYYTNSVI